MAIKKGGLGKGLDALLSHLENPMEATTQRNERLCHLPLDLIDASPYQPRKIFKQEQLQELAESLRTQGVIQPIVVREVEGERYELVAGERRWRAAQLAELSTLPAIVRVLTDEAAAALALIENIQREELNPIDEAQALQRLSIEFNLTHEAIAKTVGRSRTAVTNQLRLLQLPVDVQALVSQNKLQMGHARALLALPEGLQYSAAQQVVQKDLSVRATEALVKRLQQSPKKVSHSTLNPHIIALEETLSERLSTKVKVRETSKGKGKLEIYYYSLDELEGILERVKHEKDV